MMKRRDFLKQTLKGLAVTGLMIAGGGKIVADTNKAIAEDFNKKNNFSGLTVSKTTQGAAYDISQNLEGAGGKDPNLNEGITTMDQDPFDRVKGFINSSDKTEVDHYNLLLKTELEKDQGHIIGLKTALLALHNDVTISDKDKEILALILFEFCVGLPTDTPNRNIYFKMYEARLKTDQGFRATFKKYSAMQGEIMYYIASQESLKSFNELNKSKDELNKSKELNKELTEIYTAFKAANK